MMFGLGLNLGSRRAAGEAAASYASIVENGVLAEYVTFSTNTAVRTYFDSAGVLQTAAAHTPRLDYDPETLVFRGLLMEPTSTNQCLWNRDFTNAAWTKTNITAAKSQTGIDNVSNSASLLSATAANGTVTQAFTLSSSAYCGSFYLKRVTGSGNIDVTIDNGTTWTTVAVTSNWKRFRTPFKTAANPTVGIRIVTSGDEVAVDFAQVEASGRMTSPIATTTASVQRVGELATISDLADIGHDATQGTIYAEAVAGDGDNAGIPAFLRLWNGTNNERLILSISNSPSFAVRADVYTGGVLQASGSTANVSSAFATMKAAMSYAENDVRWCLAGGAVVTDSSVTLPSVDRAVVAGGGSAASTSPMWVKHLRYYPSIQDVQALTT